MEKSISILENFRDNIIVDCGHIIISGTNDNYCFGQNGSCSEGELLSFKTGLSLISHLRLMNKKAKLNLCLSDLAGINGGNEGRRYIYEGISSGDKFKFIPKEYIHLMDKAGFNENDIEINLQSKGNDKFKKIIRRTISNISKKKIENHYREMIFNEYNAVFITNDTGEMFSFTTPFLFNHIEENQFFDGNWWADNDVILRDSWLKKLPFLKIKKTPFINLYESGGKVLCPATYGGLLSHYSNENDHIAIYSRKDDAFIGEKIIRGGISSNILDKKFSRNCLQIIFSNHNEAELSVIWKDSLRCSEENYESFIKKITPILNLKGLVLL